MNHYQNILWGYSLDYPESWHLQKDSDAIILTAPAQSYPHPRKAENQGQITLRPEWNPEKVAAQKRWNLHIGKVAGMIGAKRVGSSPWQLGPLKGMEAELALPKKNPLRLWTGILVHERMILHLLVTHHKEDRTWFEPQATSILRSLRVHAPASTSEDELMFPLPPGYTPADPQDILEDIDDASTWQAFTGTASIAALQAFYLRELPSAGWDIAGYDPIPGPPEPGFARLALQREGVHLIMGILPAGGDEPASAQTGTLVLRQLTAP